MMQALRWVFLGLFIYGLWAGMLGGALLALLMWALVCYATGVFAAQDTAYNNSKAAAQLLQAPTIDTLDKYECECMADKL
jgi:hypothetical protein